MHSQAGTTSIGYDDNGNMTSMTLPGPVVWSYGYNPENRLTSVGGPNYAASYMYTVDGLRLRAQESNAANTDKWFQYDGVRPVLEGTLSGDTFTSVNRYTWEGDTYYSPLIHADIGGSNRYYLYDGLGSSRQLLNDDQTVTDTYTYEAFGNLMGSTGSTPNPYKYVGSLGYYQTGSSLQHLGARYYMPEIGRFLTQDPLGDGHPYAYCDSDPAGYVDPSGLVLDTIVDVGFVGWDIWDLAKCPSWGNLGALGLDIGGLLIPFVPAIAGRVAKAAKYSDDAAALTDLARQAKRRGVTSEEAKILREWAREYKVRSRGPEIHPRRPRGKDPHIHIGPVDHIRLR